MPDLWFYGILNFSKKGRDSSNFRKITHKYITSIKELCYQIWPKSIEAFKFFLDFEFFENFFKIV